MAFCGAIFDAAGWDFFRDLPEGFPKISGCFLCEEFWLLQVSHPVRFIFNALTALEGGGVGLVTPYSPKAVVFTLGVFNERRSHRSPAF